VLDVRLGRNSNWFSDDELELSKFMARIWIAKRLSNMEDSRPHDLKLPRPSLSDSSASQ
jgi:hypothetical protein